MSHMNRLSYLQPAVPAASGEADNVPGPMIAEADLVIDGPLGAGKGKQGDVFRARLRGTTAVAVKEIPTAKLSEKNLQNFKNEVKIMSRINHPNVCLFLGAQLSPEEGRFRVVTELLRRDLSELLEAKREHLSLFAKVKLAKDVCRGMIWLHHCGVVHLDLKPENILLDEHDTAKIHDFGFSRILTANTIAVLEHPHNLIEGGTPLYCPPERLNAREHREEYRRPADVYAFGIILWQIVTRRRPFENHTNLAEFKKAVLAGERPPLPESLRASRLEWIMCQCWHGDPLQRPTFAQLIEPLDEASLEAAIPSLRARQFWAKAFWLGVRCSTCETQFGQGVEARLMPCGHAFCRACAARVPVAEDLGRRWLTCPVQSDAKCRRRAPGACADDLLADPRLAYKQLSTSVSWERFAAAFAPVIDLDAAALTDGELPTVDANARLPLAADDAPPPDAALLQSVDESELERFARRGPHSEQRAEAEFARRDLVLKAHFVKYLLNESGTVTAERFGKILSVLGGLDATQPSVLLYRVDKLMNEDWFFGDMDANQAFARLKNKPIGCFLVRLSSKAGTLVVSVVIKKDKPADAAAPSSAEKEKEDTVVHFRLETRDDGPGVRMPFGNSQWYSDVGELVTQNANLFTSICPPEGPTKNWRSFATNRHGGYLVPMGVAHHAPAAAPAAVPAAPSPSAASSKPSPAATPPPPPAVGDMAVVAGAGGGDEMQT